MSKSLIFVAAVASLVLAACIPPPPVPSQRHVRDVSPPSTSPDPYAGASDPRAIPDPNPPSAPEQPTAPGEYPTARFTANPNEVVSPYEPYNLIDVEGFKSGQLARDPSNQKIFRVP